MSRKKKWIDILLFLFFVVAFIFFVIRMKAAASGDLYSPGKVNSAIKGEAFDPTLSRLRSVTDLRKYCDSVQQKNPADLYPEIVSGVMARRFYHGYSYYSLNNNPFSVLLEPVIKEGINAIVVPDDIMKYEYAACSQQSIVAMEVLKEKGYDVRKVGMFDNHSQGGHFAFEAYYDSSWHFFDTNQEPDTAVLMRYNRPPASFLKDNPHVVALAYHERNDTALFQHLLESSEPGPVNVYPAPNALLYQKVTKWAVNFGWLVILLFIVFRRWRRRNANSKKSV